MTDTHGVSWETILGVISIVGFLAMLIGAVSKMKDDLTGVESRSRVAMEQQEQKILLVIEKEASASQQGYSRLEARLNEMQRDAITRQQFEAALDKIDGKLDRIGESVAGVRETVAATHGIRAAE